MEKLPMCRICLAENVRMYLVANRNLHELYEKLTDIPFVTEDKRPILACFFCCAKLKQCYRLLRQSLEAEELFTLMMNDDYELNPLINQAHQEFCCGLIKSPIEQISLNDECQTENTIKEELPAVCEGVDDVIEPKEEHQSDELEPENLYNSCLDVGDIPPHHSESDLEDDVSLMEFKTDLKEEQEVSKKKRRARETTKLEPENLDNSCLDVADIPPHHSESDFEDDVPLMQFKTEVEEEQEVSKKKRRARETIKLEPENLDNSCLDVADIPPHHSESDFEDDDVPLMQFKTEVEEDKEVSKKKRRARETARVNDAKNPKLDTRKTKEKDAITAEQMRKNKSDSKVIRTTQKRTSKPGTYFREPYKCDQRSFSEKSNLTKHIRLHTGEKPYRCDVCQRNFSVKGNLTNHIRIHTGEKPYNCHVCQRNFSVKSTLTNHIRIHTGEKPYKCNVCQRNFSNKTTLTHHIRTHTGEKPYKCDVCQRNFSNKSTLTHHIRIHTGEKPYKCDVCHFYFSQKIHLSQHTRIHNGKKPYRCDVCQRNFSVKSTLTKHMRIHTGEKPYKCDVCQRNFSYKTTLTQHIRKHTGGKPYRCDVCQCSFSEKSTLTKHMRIHTGEKPYKCDVCQGSFRYKCTLTNHIRIHTGEKN